ncbi:MAG: thioredoxin family protein [Candidatus Sumerlaeota bacterium]
MKSRILIFASSLLLLLGTWYVSTQESRAGEKAEKENSAKAEKQVVQDVEGKKAFQKALKDNTLVLVDFHATWCPPCKKLKPTIHSLAKKYEGKVAVIAVDTDKNAEVAKEHGVRGIPDVRLFQNGKQVEQWVGWRPEDQCTKKIDKVLEGLKEKDEAKDAEKEETEA